MAIQKITSGILADGAIVAADIANGSITTAKIADGNVTSAKIDTVANTKITGLVTASQIANVANTQVTGSIEATQVGTTVSQLFGMRNRIINGAMEIDQRNAGASVTASTSGAYALDRWYLEEATDGAATVQQVSDGPTGFTNSLKVTVTSTDASIGASQYFEVDQNIEGFNTADLGFGTASASTITISFWVKSSLTGTFGGSIRNSAANRSYPFSYTINAANTWEKETITIAGDTTGTWIGATNGIGLRLTLALAAGSSLSGTVNTWAGTNLLAPTGSTNLMGTASATWQITGVQLEIGSSATPFERRLFNQELANCQRYFEKSYNLADAVGSNASTTMILSVPAFNLSSVFYTQSIYYKVSKRSTPTVTPYAYNGTSGQWHTGVIGTNEQLGNATVIDSTENKFGLTVAYTVTPTGAYGLFAASAEL